MDGTLTFSLLCLIITRVNGLPLVRDKSDFLRFLVLADWGGKPTSPFKTKTQVAVAEQMAITAERESASFILALGDNMYMTGVRNAYDQRFKATFEEVYYHASLQIPWHIIAGNHDYYQNAKAQILYSKLSPRWIFPSFYYKVTKHIPGGKTLDILMLDTIKLCGQMYLESDGSPRIGEHFRSFASTEEWRWLEQNLKDSKSDYLLVAGHYPVYSVGNNGPTGCLIKRLEPLLYKYHVTAYLSGHDHNLQHIQTTNGIQHMDYFVTGSGSYICPLGQVNLHSIPENSLKFFFDELGGFACIDVSSTAMIIQFIDISGTIRHVYEMRPRGDSQRRVDT